MKKALSKIRIYITSADLALFTIAFFCTVYGFVLIYSANHSYGSNRNFLVQLVAAATGIVGAFILSRLDYATMCDYWYIFLGLAVIAIGLTLAFGTGPTAASTNRNWINFGAVSIQPSELVKLAFLISFSSCLDRNRERLNTLSGLVRVLLHFFFYIAMIYVQGDMGTTVVFAFMGLAMIFAAGINIRYIIIGAVALVAAAPFIWNKLLAGYMRTRILVGFNPELDPLVSGYQVIQSKIAIGSGGLMGKGFLQGSQIQNEILPAKHTDFIFAVSGEEFGFIGSLLVILLLFAVMARVMQNAFTSKDNAGSLICFGVFAMLFAQTFENLGMCLGFLPVIGITLPFFSYGGSSILSVWLSIGLVSSVYMHKKTSIFSL